MSDCSKIESDLSALIDGELPGDRQMEVIEHVDHCPRCSQRVAELQRLVTGVAALPQAQPAPQFLADVRRKLHAPQPAAGWVDALFRPVWWKVPVEALAVIAVVVGVVSFVRPRPQPEPPRVVRPAPAISARILTDERAKETVAGAERRPENVADEALPENLASVARQPAGPAVIGGALPELPETMIVRGDSVVAVRLRVENLAKDLNGRVEQVTPSNTFLVLLPKSKVATFRNEVTGAKKTISYATVQPAEPDPVVGVEVIVEP